tara:strand:- start:1918 stop:3306 length:1389 start_codon:yes stop_codon:yes gene_type:complete
VDTKVRTVKQLKDLVSVVYKFLGEKHVVFLDSAQSNDDYSRFSYLTCDPFLVVSAKGNTVDINRLGKLERLTDDPWTVLKDVSRDLMDQPTVRSGPFLGGGIGYWAYDLARSIQVIPELTADDNPYPDMIVAFYDWVLIYDHELGIVSLSTTDKHPIMSSKDREDWVYRKLSESYRKDDHTECFSAQVGTVSQNYTIEKYTEAVNKVKEYLVSGEIYQANISQRFSLPFQGNIWNLYRQLRESNPAPFSAFIQFPEINILSVSPELFLSLECGKVQTRPIKGTRPSSEDPVLDLELAAELSESEKDQAENIMIVDLMRNDLGKVCKVGSVEVSELMKLERHPTVWHLVSIINGVLEEDKDAIDLLKDCFPGGSITGAPKIRAMEIIEEIEPSRRGIYCGSIGYISFNGDMMTNIAIRTITVKNGDVTFQSGGGIVYDSDPYSEYLETMDKARGITRIMGDST